MSANYYNKRHPASRITPGQITAIKMGQKQLNIDDDDYRATLWSRYQVDSCRDLTYDQAKDLIEDYIARGFVLVQPANKAKRHTTPHPPPKLGGGGRKAGGGSMRPPRDSSKVVSLPTRDEIDKINALAGLITWRAENGLALFLEKRCRVSGGKVKTSLEAYNAIEGLKKYFTNLMAKQHGKAWWVLLYENPQITAFISEHCPAEYRK